MRKFVFLLLGMLLSFLILLPAAHAQGGGSCSASCSSGDSICLLDNLIYRMGFNNYDVINNFFTQAGGTPWSANSATGTLVSSFQYILGGTTYTLNAYKTDSYVSVRRSSNYGTFWRVIRFSDFEGLNINDCSDLGIDNNPSHCSDLVINYDEAGIDCGGSCNSECDAKICPENWVYNSFFDRCEKQNVAGDAYNNCKPGWEPIKNIDGSIFYDSNNQVSCTYVGDSPEPIWVNSEDYAGSPPPDDPMPEIHGFMTGVGFSVTEFVYPETVTDNGDGTFTYSTTTEKIASNGSFSTTTTNTIKDGAGNVISSNTVTTGELAPEDNPGNYSYGFEFGGNVYDTNLGDDMPEEKDGGALLTGWLAESPFLGVLNGAQITTSNATCLLTVDVFGSTLRFDFCRWQAQLAAAGQFLVGLSTFAAGLVVFRGWGAK